MLMPSYVTKDCKGMLLLTYSYVLTNGFFLWYLHRNLWKSPTFIFMITTIMYTSNKRIQFYADCITLTLTILVDAVIYVVGNVYYCRSGFNQWLRVAQFLCMARICNFPSTTCLIEKTSHLSSQSLC